MSELTTRETALARSRMYDLLSRIYLHGMDAGLLPIVADIPELAAVLPATFDADEAAAEHQAIFGFNVFPYQSIFLDPAGLLGGDEPARVQASYAGSGFAPANSDASPDHIGYELAFVAFLCGAEADAWEDDLPQTAARMQQRQADFMTAHLLRWIAPFLAALARQDSPFYAALAALTQTILVDHAAAVLSAAPVELSFTLPPAPDLAANDEAGLRDIADNLLAPPVSGLYLSRADIDRLGRRFDLPRGFGERRQLLVNLLRAAGTYEQFPALCTEIAALAAGDDHRYAEMGRDYPSFHPWSQLWNDRVQLTVAQLETLAQQAAAT